MARGHDASHVAIIDVVRGAAALAVAYMHCRETIWIGVAAHWSAHKFDLSLASIVSYSTIPFAFGSIGVPILFVVSGYVIHRRAAQKLARGQAPALSSRAFFRRRFIRIYPTFVAAIFVTWLCDAATGLFVNHPRLGDASFTALVYNLLALQGVFSRFYGSNGPLWSLGIEIQFYLVYPIALQLRQRLDAEKMLLASFLLSLFGYLIFERNGVTAFPQYYVCWWIGAYLADREAQAGGNLSFLLATIAIVAGAALNSFKYIYIGFLFWSLGTAPILYCLIRSGIRRGEILSTALKPIGDFSYSIYAVHMPLVVLASAVFFRGAHQANIFWSFSVMVAVLLIAYVFYLFAEKPFVRMLNSERGPVSLQ
jgi:peptidoglycan/LPS O-acetylase OafA/YrhL